ncbi:AFG1-like ATPase family protein, partial [Vibrio harveyi]
YFCRSLDGVSVYARAVRVRI